MISELLGHLRNYFEVSATYGTFRITATRISPLPEQVQAGQYIRIQGSAMNDGVYLTPLSADSGLTVETFTGTVYGLAVPKDLVALNEEIDEWIASDAGKATGYTSESFGGYSYNKGSDANGAPLTWQGVFRSRLNQWRKV